MKIMKIIKIGALLVVIVAAVSFLIGMYLYQLGTNFKDLTIGEPILTSLPDGEYRGEFKQGHIGSSVTVTIAEGRISAIGIDQGSTGRVSSLAESIISQQSLQVETISGATWSSRAFLKAVEAALTKERRVQE